MAFDRTRRASFDAVAWLYDEARPKYLYFQKRCKIVADERSTL